MDKSFSTACNSEAPSGSCPDTASYSTPTRSTTTNTSSTHGRSSHCDTNPCDETADTSDDYQAPHVITPPPKQKHFIHGDLQTSYIVGSRVMELKVFLPPLPQPTLDGMSQKDGETVADRATAEEEEDITMKSEDVAVVDEDERMEEDTKLPPHQNVPTTSDDEDNPSMILDKAVSETTANIEATATTTEASLPSSTATVIDLKEPTSNGDYENYKKSQLGGFLAYEAVDSDDEDEYVVDDLIKIRETKSGSFEFLVKWAGYHRSTWEPRENLNSSLDDRVQELMDGYETRVSSASGSTVGGKKRKKKNANGTSVASKQRKVSHPKRGRTKKTTVRKRAVKAGRGVVKNSPSKLAVQDSHHEALRQMDFLHDSVAVCFASQIFGRRLRKYTEVPLTTAVQPVAHHGQETMVLLGTKEQTETAGFRQQRTQTLYYVVTEAPGVSKISVQDELEKFADFAAIPTRNKLASRLELLFTDAKSINTSKKSGYRLVEDLSPDDFEEIDEVDHIGCGFIPRAMIENLLGSGTTVANCSSIQVRILVPKLGLFKGMLQVKPGIQRIQLPSSMKKVGPSLVKDRHDLAVMLVHNIFPSKRNKYIAKMLNGEFVPPSERENLQQGDGRKGTLSPMMSRVLQEAHVDITLIKEYVEKVQDDVRALQHTTLIGLCDPTEGRAIPNGFVFLTGVVDPTGGGKHLLTAKSVVVSRFPCTSRFDQTTLKVLKEKPATMSEADWDDLCRRQFGEIIFGKPKKGNVPIPETIANGDLDGDQYFVTWYAPFIRKTMNHKRNDRVRRDAEVTDVIRNDNWFQEAQAFLCDTGAQRNYSHIRGVLHSQWEQHVDERNPDAEQFGEAFKRSLDIKKHGGQIYLPLRLWEKLRPSLHQFLTSER